MTKRQKECSMKPQSFLSLLTMTILFFVTTTQDLRAADSTAAGQAKIGANHPFHTITRTELHQRIQNSQKQALDARKCIRNFLSRPDIKAAIRHAGIRLENAEFQVALLTDEEALRLNRQIMSLDLQNRTAGGAVRVIIGLILLALSIYWLVNKVT
jgi:hypothetical protein